MPLLPLAFIGCVVLFYKVASGSAKKFSTMKTKKSNKKQEDKNDNNKI